MPRNVLKGRSDRDLAAEFVLRSDGLLKHKTQAPVKLYSSLEIYHELERRMPTTEVNTLIAEARQVAKILGD